jgi:hypothetical protein
MRKCFFRPARSPPDPYFELAGRSPRGNFLRGLGPPIFPARIGKPGQLRCKLGNGEEAFWAETEYAVVRRCDWCWFLVLQFLNLICYRPTRAKIDHWRSSPSPPACRSIVAAPCSLLGAFVKAQVVGPMPRCHQPIFWSARGDDCCSRVTLQCNPCCFSRPPPFQRNVLVALEDSGRWHRPEERASGTFADLAQCRAKCDVSVRLAVISRDPP